MFAFSQFNLFNFNAFFFPYFMFFLWIKSDLSLLDSSLDTTLLSISEPQ